MGGQASRNSYYNSFKTPKAAFVPGPGANDQPRFAPLDQTSPALLEKQRKARLKRLGNGPQVAHELVSRPKRNEGQAVQMDALAFIVKGQLIHAPEFGSLVVIRKAIVGVNARGNIAFLHDGDGDTDSVGESMSGIPIIHLEADQILMPGLVDLHVHAPQYQYTGTATDQPLMKWLQIYAFPAETRVSAPEVARSIYSHTVQRLLQNGTTTAMYFGTIHRQATEILAEVADNLGQRAFVGKVNMDCNAQEGYQETTEESLKETEAFIEHVQAKCSPLVEPVITPRFTPVCTMALMKGLASLAEKYSVHIQSHISESLDEVEFALQVHGKDDTAIFEEAGLLTPKTLMAHGVHLTPANWSALHSMGTAVIHCPLSHFYFANGTLAIREALLNGQKIGLGTDVAGGYSPSMLNAIRNTCIMSRACEVSTSTQHAVREGGEKGSQCIINHREAFWLATMGGARCLGLEDRIGSLEAGKAFDAILVSLPRCLKPGQVYATEGPIPAGPIFPFDVFSHDTLEDKFEKFLNLGDERNIAAVWIQGRLVVGKTP